jgi:hypothetical protein
MIQQATPASVWCNLGEGKPLGLNFNFSSSLIPGGLGFDAMSGENRYLV